MIPSRELTILKRYLNRQYHKFLLLVDTYVIIQAMNRRDFIKTASVAAVAPTVITSGAPSVATKEHYFIECYTHNRDSYVGPYKQQHLVEHNKFDTVEDAVQYVFEHAKMWNLQTTNMYYNIMWSSSKGRIIQAGNYQFRDKETSCMMYQQGQWWSAAGWHGSPPYTDYYAVEAG